MNTKNQKAAARHEELLTQEEVAALLKVTVRTVERWQQSNSLTQRFGPGIHFTGAQNAEVIPTGSGRRPG